MTSYGELNRMTQFKDKAGSQRDLVSAACLPRADAADVLAYRAHEVPVGEDQRQHVELMRDVAERFNGRFGETLVVPEGRVPDVGAPDHGPPVPGPQDVDDRRQPAGHRVRDRRAGRDRQEVPLGGHRLRYRGQAGARQGRHHEPDRHPRGGARQLAPEEVEASFNGSGYGAFKQAVADAVVEYLAPVRERYQELRADEGALEHILTAGADKARAIAADTLVDVREAMGVGPVRHRQ